MKGAAVIKYTIGRCWANADVRHGNHSTSCVPRLRLSRPGLGSLQSLQSAAHSLFEVCIEGRSWGTLGGMVNAGCTGRACCVTGGGEGPRGLFRNRWQRPVWWRARTGWVGRLRTTVVGRHDEVTGWMYGDVMVYKYRWVGSEVECRTLAWLAIDVGLGDLRLV